MNRLRNILGAALLAALTIGGVALAQSVWIHRNQWVNSGLTAGVGYFRSNNEPSPSNGGAVTGELGVRVDVAGGDYQLGFFQPSGTWEYLAALGTDQTFTGSPTFSGTVNTTGNVNLGNEESDDITANGPVFFNVKHETFDFQVFHTVEEDYTAAVVTDVGENYIVLPGSQVGIIWYSFEQAFAGTFTPFSVAGELSLTGIVDDADTDGIDLTIGGDPTTSFIWDEDNSSNSYCEVSVTLADISQIDELYFGVRLAAARFDANDANAADTYAMFRVPDNAGDLDIETELNAGGTLNDDTGVTWADAQTKVLRVNVNADTVSFLLDGAAVTQTNAVLNFDDGDRAVCFFGFQNSAEAGGSIGNINYVEFGKNQ